MKHWKIILSFVAIFLAGSVTGGVIGFHLSHRMLFSPPKPEEMSARMLARLKSDLDLSPEQEANAAVLLAGTSQLMPTTHAEMRNRMDSIMTASEADIAVLLTPEQQKKFERFTEKRRAMTMPK